MMSRTSTVLNTLQNVQLFMTKNADVLGALNTSASRKALDELEATLSGHATNQTSAVSGTKAAIARQRVLRNTLLVKYLRPISAVAQAQLNQAPDFLALKLPRALKTTQQVLAAAESMGAAAAKHAETFIAAGLAPTFITELQSAAADLKAGAVLRGHTINSQIGATNALKVATNEANKIVKALDALIEPALANNPALSFSRLSASTMAAPQSQNACALSASALKSRDGAVNLRAIHRLVAALIAVLRSA